MKELDDGRYNKVDLIGNTMKYHPHGDAAIGDATVLWGRRIFSSIQGNWGNTYG